MKNIKVKINQAAWGQEVMSGNQMSDFLGGLGGQVSSKLPGSTVKVSSSRTVRGGGRRARVTVTTTIPMSEEADTGQALSALKSVVGSAHKPKGGKKYKERARKREERRS